MLSSGAWLTPERVRMVALVSGIAGLAMLLFLYFGGQGTLDPFGQPIGTDFSAFWHAGRLANDGSAPSAWDVTALNAEVRVTHPGSEFATAWVYPPVFLLIASPLAMLPYLHALAIWQAVSVLLLAAALKAILTDWKSVAVCLASPLTPLVLAHGQNAFLTAALLGAGLASLAVGRGTGAGYFGGLAYKPQLALQLAPFLLFTKNWRALGVAFTVAALVIALSWLLWGTEAWLAFAASASATRHFMEEGAVGLHKSASLFSLARMWGAPVGPAYLIQALSALSGLALLWKARHAPPFVLGAAACVAIALSTPYLLDYDIALVGLGAVFLFAEGRRTSFLEYERTALAYIWATPWFARQVAEVVHLPLLPISMVLLAVLVFRRAVLARSGLPSRCAGNASSGLALATATRGKGEP
ncbi:glycosyltransferase family 87 protein [Sphingomonas sediminicola]